MLSIFKSCGNNPDFLGSLLTYMGFIFYENDLTHLALYMYF